jgi:hypothetical protein
LSATASKFLPELRVALGGSELVFRDEFCGRSDGCEIVAQAELRHRAEGEPQGHRQGCGEQVFCCAIEHAASIAINPNSSLKARRGRLLSASRPKCLLADPLVELGTPSAPVNLTF